MNHYFNLLNDNNTVGHMIKISGTCNGVIVDKTIVLDSSCNVRERVSEKLVCVFFTVRDRA